MPGPKPKPTQLKIIAGNPGHRRLNTREPMPVGDLIEPPAHFDAEQRDVWNYAIEHAPKGLLKKIDAGVLEVWCQAHVTHRHALAGLRKTGLLVKAPHTGLPIQSPYLPIVNRQALLMMRAIDHLGFSPASRSRIVTGEAGDSFGDWGEIAAG